MQKETTQAGSSQEWRLRLFSKSLAGQLKLRSIAALLGGSIEGRRGLDIGGHSGVFSQNLRRFGGTWRSLELDAKSAAACAALVGDGAQIGSDGKFPFEDASFDVVVAIDVLERVADESAFVAECHRVLKPKGWLIFTVPLVKSWGLLPPLRQMLGLTDERYGRLRPGYTEPQLFTLLKDGFDVQDAKTYSRFFVELVDTLGRFVVRQVNKDRSSADFAGMLADEQDFRKIEKAFRVYSFLYPVFWLAAQLDGLLFFTRGYHLVARGKRRQWIPRRTPVLADGRSIAEEALGGKIGTAAPF